MSGKIGSWFSFDGGFVGWAEKAFDVVGLSLLWLAFCLPLVTIGASTTALYYTAVKVIRQNRGTLLVEFWRSFRANLGKGTLLWVIFFVLLFLLELNMNIAADMGGPGRVLQAVYAILTFAMVAVMLYAFAALSRFEMPTGWIVKIAVYMTFRYLPATLSVLAVAGAAGWFVLQNPLTLMLVPACAALLLSLPMEQVLKRHTPLPESGTGEDIEE